MLSFFPISVYRLYRLVLPFFLLTCICISSAQIFELKNNQITATFGARGLTSVSNQDSSAQVHFTSDEFSFSIDQDEFDSANLTPKIERRGKGQITYTYGAYGYTVNVVYDIRPDWHFVTKQLQISETPRAAYKVQSIEPLLMEIAETIESRFTPETYLPQYGAHENQLGESSPRGFGMFLRLTPGNGLMLVVQNPFLTAIANTNKASLSYQPEMEWQVAWGPFLSDIACIGPYKLSSNRIPARMVLEWQLPPASMPSDGADRSEIEAFTDCVRAFLVHRSPSPISIEVGWTLNDYQIDVSTPEGRSEYKRIIDTTADLGLENLLYGPANYSLAQIADDTDDWNWEHVLWLGLGQQIRAGKWDATSSPIPPSVTEMLDYAKSKNVGLLAYVYPSLPFAQNSGWLVRNLKRPAKNEQATLASREFQAFLVHELLTFKRRTGIAGYSFDYTYLNLPGSSFYAQWWGWRRVLETLRKAEPGIVIDGRQTYQTFGPWTWLAGSYPHPTGNDEQPESFTPFPDLHFDRVSADRMRFVNYWYRNYQFAPEEIVPGYMTHQTERSINIPSGDHGGEREKLMFSSYRARDWDYLGYRYSVISSIATAGWNNVMDMIPARDLEEFENFSAEDKAWIRHWLGWTTNNREYLRQTRTILGQPALGKADGTAALIGDGGYLFLFNPNYARVSADFRLDASIGLTSGKRFLLREIYPQEGGLIGKPGAGLWTYGDEVHPQLDGTSATVLQLLAAESEKQVLLVFGSGPSHAGPHVTPTATVSGGALRVEHASGEPGLQRDIGVLLPNTMPITNMTVNGHAVRYSQDGSYVSAKVRFAGQPFTRSEQIQLVHESQTGSPYRCVPNPPAYFCATQHSPQELAIPWTSDDYNTTWLAPERLLLFLQIAEPKDTMNPTMTLDGQPLYLMKAYSSVRVHAPSLVGFYADLSHVQPDVRHKITLRLPKLAPRQFQGVFFDNVEPEYSDAITE